MNNSVIDIDPVSEVPTYIDDLESDVPKRRPIGWNYQSVYTAPSHEAKVNGTSVCKTDKNDTKAAANNSSDDIEILEILSPDTSIQNNSVTHQTNSRLKNNPNVTEGKHIKLKSIPSSSRKELKKIFRNVSQTSIEKFFKPDSPDKGTKSEPLTKIKSEKESSKSEDTSSGSSNLGTSEVKEDLIENETETEIQKEKNLVNGKDDGGEVSENQTNLDKKEITLEHSKSIIDNFIEKWKSIKTFDIYDEQVKQRLCKHYNACHKSYILSRKFMTGLKIGTARLNKDNLVVFLSSIIKNLKKYKDVPYLEKKKRVDDGETSNTNDNEKKEEEKELTEEELKKKRKLRKIEKAMVKISNQIEKLETEEVDLDDEDNSSYLILERLKSQFVKLDELYCKTAECSSATGRPVEKKFRYEGSRYPEINKRITAWVNKNRCFPEYMDVLNLVKKVTKVSLLPLRPEAVRVQAQEIFRDVGIILKGRREKDDFFCIRAYAELEGDLNIDPAADDVDLRRRLKENESVGNKRLDDVFQHFVDEELKKKDGEKTASGNESKESDKAEGKGDKDDEKAEVVVGHKEELEADVNADECGEETEVDDTEESGSEKADSEDDDDDDDAEGDDIRCLEEKICPQKDKSPAEVSENEDTKVDESDDEIQEILNAPAVNDRYSDDFEEDDDEEDLEEVERKDLDPRKQGESSEEDVEIASSPASIVLDENSIVSEDDDVTSANRYGSIPEITTFKKRPKSPSLDESFSFLPKKCKYISSSEPEIVDLD